MKTLCIFIFILLTSPIKYQTPKQRELNISEILKNWTHQEKRLDVKISKAEVDVAEISLNQTPFLTDAENR